MTRVVNKVLQQLNGDIGRSWQTAYRGYFENDEILFKMSSPDNPVYRFRVEQLD